MNDEKVFDTMHPIDKSIETLNKIIKVMIKHEQTYEKMFDDLNFTDVFQAINLAVYSLESQKMVSLDVKVDEKNEYEEIIEQARFLVEKLFSLLTSLINGDTKVTGMISMIGCIYSLKELLGE